MKPSVLHVKDPGEDKRGSIRPMKELYVRIRYVLCLLVWIAAVPAAMGQSPDLTVVIIRHGEKNDATGNLSCKGLHRSLLLPHILNSKFRKPSYVYVPAISNGKSTAHGRMLQTVTPMVVQDNLAVNTRFDVNASVEVGTDILKRTGVVLVVWEHGNIPSIAGALGVKDQHLDWDDGDYDSIWVITYANSKKGKLKATLTVDKEGLNPPDACNF